MILGIGVDIIKTARFTRMSQRFIARVFTPGERAYILRKNHVSAAGIFAAKEAVVKALGTGFKGFWPDSIEITHDERGKPYVILHGEAKLVADRLAGQRDYSIELSISHTDTDAVAFAIIACCASLH
ncbi:MAG: holo-ACP synthase [Defluviitaleaceae bacterium]|nr:holo-ACP synthase [Defluviitaleaceae bacterium]